ncbi:mevalonate kinase family protein [Thiomicrorhabdus lithotrophica]|uniref:GHMP kinase n=1 Tax=Thiomicrorhabdus lithotrophica TaxID=2949997 RepID=A0ABY8CD85_9GAMM|nr:GHMP kinase [Thiomicrorhabdus lithotrophica]WEJ62088.1 GHMP kinase [Thiomicrorhabdus lithotrophica]
MSDPLNFSQMWRSVAPANTMILGEHSVVYGQPALACALDQFVTIHWQIRKDSAINIYSALGEHHTQLDKITSHPKLTFVIAALQAFQNHLTCGLDIQVESEFSSTIGLGSSAAVLAAMLSGLNTICKTDYKLIQLFEIGHRVIIDLQGRGSGTDLAASLSGGTIFFQPKTDLQPISSIHKLNIQLPLVLIYAGYKTPTSDVLKQVAIAWQDKPNELEMLYRSMAQVTKQAFQALQNQQLETFYQACSDYQILMDRLGVNDKNIQKIIDALIQCESIHCAKISGSGLGDCVLGIGNLDNCNSQALSELAAYQSIAIKVSNAGAQTESTE